MIHNRLPQWRHLAHQKGLTLIELLLAMALGLIVTLASISLLLTSKSGYVTIDDMSRIEENGQLAIDTITRAVYQAGFVDWSSNSTYLVERTMSPSVIGFDNTTLIATVPDITSPVIPGVHGSDVLAIRFFGSGIDIADNTIVDCAGYGIAAPPSQNAAHNDTNGKGRGWSIFYVEADADGEPELRCKYRDQNKWHAITLVRGVESFQVLYGIDSKHTGFADQFVTATEIHRLDAQHTGSTPDSYAHTWWRNVIAVRVALLLRGMDNMSIRTAPRTYHLFGEAYSKQDASKDEASIDTATLSPDVQQRMRKIVGSTIQLRNTISPRMP